MTTQQRIPIITAAILFAALGLPGLAAADELDVTHRDIEIPHPVTQYPSSLYIQYHNVTLPDPVPPNKTTKIWTRAYGLEDGSPIIPGPTFYIHPKQLFEINFVNTLSEKKMDAHLRKWDLTDLGKIESLVPKTAPGSSKDETTGNIQFNDVDQKLAKNIVYHEVNIPHNPDNINLHVHGLHVAPSQDDVTIVVVPEGTDPNEVEKYSQPAKFLGQFTELSVSDRPVQNGRYIYSYRIPEGHLPGTHWYHSHKHGSTALQVENGMAGAIVMGQGTDLDPLSAANLEKDFRKRVAVKERVMLVQGLLNYGLNVGTGTGKGGQAKAGKASLFTGGASAVTLNGDTAATATAKNGQLERWRIVNATANHKSVAYIWVGGTCDGGKTYTSVPVHAIAVDGVTLPKKVEVTAKSPILMSPGNRLDLLVQLQNELCESAQNYEVHLLQNVPTGAKILDADMTAREKEWLTNGPMINPLIFEDKDKLPAINGASQQFSVTETSTMLVPGHGQQPLAPLLRVVPSESGLLNIALANEGADAAAPVEPAAKAVGWTPINPGQYGGGLIGKKLLAVTVTDDGAPADPVSASKVDINPYSPGPQGGLAEAKKRAYVSPIGVDDILQSRPAVFDISDVQLYAQGSLPPAKSKKKSAQGQKKPPAPPKPAFKNINQFTINGRVFAMDDPIGNPNADSRVSQSAGDHLTKFTFFDEDAPEFDPIDPGINFTTTRNNALDSYVNQGYYRALAAPTGNTFNYVDPPESTIQKTGIPKFNTNTGVKTPGQYLTYKKYDVDGWHYPVMSDVTGLPRGVDGKSILALPNENCSYINDVPAITGGLPIAQTAEEWVLINNSAVGHPFHIHINPFFIAEIGQLTHSDAKGWHLNKIVWHDDDLKKAPKGQFLVDPVDGKSHVTANAKSPLAWMVGTWWDTILIPPRGYVKIRYWFNVPSQNVQRQVTDNANVEGVWVYHCHILRHEDRGMMMVVETQPNHGVISAAKDAAAARRTARKGLRPGGSGED